MADQRPRPIDHRGGATTSDVFILDRVAQKMAAEKQMSFGTKQLNLDKPKITKALSVDDSSHLRLTKPLDVSALVFQYIMSMPFLGFNFPF